MGPKQKRVRATTRGEDLKEETWRREIDNLCSKNEELRKQLEEKESSISKLVADENKIETGENSDQQKLDDFITEANWMKRRIKTLECQVFKSGQIPEPADDPPSSVQNGGNENEKEKRVNAGQAEECYNSETTLKRKNKALRKQYENLIDDYQELVDEGRDHTAEMVLCKKELAVLKKSFDEMVELKDRLLKQTLKQKMEIGQYKRREQNRLAQGKKGRKQNQLFLATCTRSTSTTDLKDADASVAVDIDSDQKSNSKNAARRGLSNFFQLMRGYI